MWQIYSSQLLEKFSGSTVLPQGNKHKNTKTIFLTATRKSSLANGFAISEKEQYLEKHFTNTIHFNYNLINHKQQAKRWEI